MESEMFPTFSQDSVGEHADVEKRRNENLKIFRTNEVAVVDKDWVLESLGSYTIQPLMMFLQHKASEKQMIKAGYDYKFLEEPQSCLL